MLRHPQAEFAVLASSRADGKFTLDRVPGVVGARVFVSAKGFGPRLIRDVHVPPHDRLDLGAIELARSVPIQGLVVTASGAPIAGAQVDLIESPALAPGAHQNLLSIFHDLRADDEALDKAVTAADGALRCREPRRANTSCSRANPVGRRAARAAPPSTPAWRRLSSRCGSSKAARSKAS